MKISYKGRQKEIERSDIEKNKHTRQTKPLLLTASADLLQILREAGVEVQQKPFK